MSMKKVSQDYEIVVKDAVQRVEGVMRRILYPKQHGDESKEVCVGVGGWALIVEFLT